MNDPYIFDVLRPLLDGKDNYLATLRFRLSRDRHQSLDPLYAEKPSDMDTLGSLVDKLVTVNLKMWHNQESLYEIRRMSQEDFEERYGNSIDEVREIVTRCCDLNVQRSRLMDAIDDHFQAVIRGHKSAEPMHQHKTY